MTKWRLKTLIITFFFLSNFLFCYNVTACKDIIACGDATEGNFNLLMKVRDPSRPGPQVLCIVPEGYEYSYHTPWTGKQVSYRNEYKYIGIASDGDIIPNIVKAGMSLSETGIAYGDADTFSRWINPTKNAWDDFDWIRYACEKADSVDMAINLLTKDAVKKMHATGVSENLFVVGPNKGAVIEADAFRYKVREITDGVEVMHNYPKELWKSQIIERLPIAWSFDTVVEKYVRNKQVIRLKSIRGIRVVEIGEDFVTVKPVGFLYAAKTKNLGVVTKIGIGERKSVAEYSVELKDISTNKAKLRVCYINKAWEEKMLEYIEPRYGQITVRDMMKWSRLHSKDLDGLRSMCDLYVTDYEAVAIYKIPKENYNKLSIGWFSPNHACSSIYVPFHICNTDIYEPYRTKEAAELCFNLLNEYDHGILNSSFEKTEEVFLNEMNFSEQIAMEFFNYYDISDFLTIIDMGMQKQAFITEQIWMDLSKITDERKQQSVKKIIDGIWNKNYTLSLKNMRYAIDSLEEMKGVAEIKNKICKIALDISKTRLDAAESVGKQNKKLNEEYDKAVYRFENGEFDSGFESLQNVYSNSNRLINGQKINNPIKKKTHDEEEIDIFLSFLIVLLIISILIIFIKLKTAFRK